MTTDIISFRGDWSLRDYLQKDIEFPNLIDLYEIKFIFEQTEYTFTLPDDTLLDVKESNTKFNSKRVSKVSPGDEVLIPFYTIERRMVPIYAIGSMREREVRRKYRTIVKEKHLVNISSVSLIKEKVPASWPFETVYKRFIDQSIPGLKPIIPLTTIHKE